MALRSLGCLRQKNGSIFSQLGSRAFIHTKDKIGKRDIVGHGKNGTYIYFDMVSMPFPAVRFKEPSTESQCLRAKEQLSWRKLTMQEKKALYRHSFCQTFSEVKAEAGGAGEWKLHVGLGLWAIICGIWVCMINMKFLYDYLPHTFEEDHKKAELKRMLILQVNPVRGLASKWDYEKNRWK